MSEKEKIDLSQLFWYFVIFSIIGLLVETMYGFLTMGVLESRKGLIIGPFCPVYGIGAVILILATYRLKGSNLKIFLVGAVVGGIVEYVLSYILEAIYGIRFWEYSYLKYNLNGRICVVYSFFWGILSIVLLKWIKLKMDYIIEKIPKRGKIEKVLFLFFIFDAFFTVWGITAYQNRVISNERNSKNEARIKIEEKLFPNERMVKIFPNLRYRTEDGKEIFIKNLL